MARVKKHNKILMMLQAKLQIRNSVQNKTALYLELLEILFKKINLLNLPPHPLTQVQSQCRSLKEELPLNKQHIIIIIIIITV